MTGHRTEHPVSVSDSSLVAIVDARFDGLLFAGIRVGRASRSDPAYDRYAGSLGFEGHRRLYRHEQGAGQPIADRLDGARVIRSGSLDEEDGRRRVWKLTPKGEAFVKMCRPIRLETDKPS